MRLLHAVFALALLPTTAFADTLVVNSLADTSDGSCDPAPGDCTLREAIDDLDDGDEIVFEFTSIPAAGPVIVLTTDLPEIDEDNVLIDGFDCTGCGVTTAASTTNPAVGFNTVIGPTIDGSSMGVVAPLLTIDAEDVTIQGLNLQNGPSHGIEIEDDSDVEAAVITGCFIGTDRTGTIAAPNAGDGIRISGRDDHVIGPGNVISGNLGDGIFLDGGTADDVEIVGNLIGTDVGAVVAIGNGGSGIHAVGPTGSGQNLNGLVIGAGTEAGRNVVSGNGVHGIFFEQKIPDALIETNTIGTNGAQNLPLGNVQDGIRFIGASGGFNHPRSNDIVGNVISGNGGAGVYGEACQNNDVLGNWIGTDESGVFGLGNGVGIHLYADTIRDTEGWEIGGGTADANVIAYNLGDGVLMDVGPGGEENAENALYINSYYGNGGLAVDLAGDGAGAGPLVPGTGPCTADSSLGNRGMPRPAITAAYLDGTTLTVEGTGCANNNVGIWEADGDPSGYGEPEVYIDGDVSDGAGVWSVTVTGSAIPVGTSITAMQLDPFDDETSEASAVLPVVDCDFDGDGYTIAICGGADCNDANPFINPGATEVCNGLDDDCDGTLLATEVDIDNDGVFACFDCDDTDPNINPNATEVCDGVDQNCDTVVDDGFDVDGDGVTTCGPDGVVGTPDDDCDDTAIGVNPNATEICNSLDDDCDGTTDEGFDVDGDGVTTCDGDCDDGDATVVPGATEVCDAVDQNCDSVIDEGFDIDGDGVTTCGPDGVLGNGDDDCDDGNAGISPTTIEVCDGVDQDCDGLVDEDFDVDGDGVTTCGPDGVLGNGDDDCDDGDAGVGPTTAEVCDGIDQDCDGLVDEDFDVDGDGVTTCGPDGVPGTGDEDCDDGDGDVTPNAAEICNGVDDDCDGFVDEDSDVDQDGFDSIPCGGDDCDDGDDAIFPGAAEICGDGIDQDCDGTDLDDVDDDGDGLSECDGDCDDTDAAVNPDAVEECNGVDDDCDGEVDEDFPEVCCDESDADGDGFSECDGDCDDANAEVSPGATELCDGIDNDCDGLLLPGEEVDEDGDGYRLCDDCDDVNPEVNPGAEEDCGDAIDNDCDGEVDEGDGDRDGFVAESCGGDDCDDDDPNAFPGAAETCEDGLDQDCDGVDAPCVDAEEVWTTGGGCENCESEVASAEGMGAVWLLLLSPALRRRRR